MSQSAIIVGAVIAMFVLYLAMNNRLNYYWSVLAGSPAGSTAPGAATAPGSPTGTTSPPSHYLVPPVKNPFGSGNLFPGVTSWF